MAANSIYQATDRTSKIVGPSLAAPTMVFLGAHIGFAIISLTLLFVVVWIAVKIQSDSKDKRTKQGSEQGKKLFAAMISSVSETVEVFRRDPIVATTFYPAVGYMVTLGAMRPFLFWLNKDVFQSDPAVWNILLAAQGGGALLGALISGTIGDRMRTTHTLFVAYLIASIVEGLLILSLVVANTYEIAVVLLIVAGVPEMFAYVTYFTIVQQRVAPRVQESFYAITLPLYDIFFAAGIVSGLLYAESVLSIGEYWIFASSFSLAPVIPGLIVAISMSKLNIIKRGRNSIERGSE